MNETVDGRADLIEEVLETTCESAGRLPEGADRLMVLREMVASVLELHPCDQQRWRDRILGLGLAEEDFAQLAQHERERRGRRPAEDGDEMRESADRALTDLGNSERLVDRFGHLLRYCHPWRCWLYFDGTRWVRDERGMAATFAKRTVRAMLQEAQGAGDKRYQELLAWALKSEGQGHLEAMVRLAESALPILPEQFDADAFLFNVQNGTLDLRTGLLRPHRADDYLLKLAPVVYDPAAPAPLWETFLARIMDGNEKLTGFLQRAAGYGLTGSSAEQCLFILHGGGANGKSTWLGAIQGVLGDYAMPAPPDLLMVKRGDGNHPTEVADLFRARFVSTIENEDGKRFSEALLKLLTGGDKLKARRLYENFWQFDPTHKFFLAANHKPVVRGQDHGIWRRIHLVPFEVTIPDREKDTTLAEKLKAERPGILRWLVEGCRAWQRDGLEPPDEVRAATRTYRAEMDVLADFLAERCIVKADAEVKAAALYTEFVAWSRGNGEHELSQKALGGRLRERGFINERKSGGFIWHGLGLLHLPPDADTPATDAATVNDEPYEPLNGKLPPMRAREENFPNNGSPSFIVHAPGVEEGPRTFDTAVAEVRL